MAPIRVLVAAEMEERHLKAMAGVHSDIQVLYSGDRAFSTLFNQESALQAGTSISMVDFRTGLREAEVLVAFRFPFNVLERAPGLKWTHLLSAGADWLEGSPILASDVIMTNSGGVAATTIAEWIICTMLMFAKRMPFAQRARQEKRWQRYAAGEISGKTLGIVGFGHIGRELARMAKALGMRVLVTHRTAAPGAPPENVDELFPLHKRLDMLTASDFVALCVPLTAESTKIIGQAELRAMKSSGYLFNISRGPVVDETVLTRALKEGWIAGAGLDVFEEEPLPEESELWDLPNVIMTPHVAGSSEQYMDRVAKLICDNLRRYIAGENLINVIDKSRGY